MLEPNITNSMKQQLLVTIPQFSPFAFTMILMISDMEIDNHTLGSTNRSPQLYVACVRNLYDVVVHDDLQTTIVHSCFTSMVRLHTMFEAPQTNYS